MKQASIYCDTVNYVIQEKSVSSLQPGDDDDASMKRTCVRGGGPGENNTMSFEPWIRSESSIVADRKDNKLSRKPVIKPLSTDLCRTALTSQKLSL